MKFLTIVLLMSALAYYVDAYYVNEYYDDAYYVQEYCDENSVNIDGVCVKFVGNSCNTYHDCPGFSQGAGCYDGICQWTQNYFSNDDNMKSYVAKNLGDVCFEDNHCREILGSSCTENSCQ